MRSGRAPRPPSRLWRAVSRGARLAMVLVAWSQGPALAQAVTVVCVPGDGVQVLRACYEHLPDQPEYGHAVLGDTPEWHRLVVHRAQGPVLIATAPRHIFEDIAPRIADLDGDGVPEIVTVQSSFDKGARLVVWSLGPRGLEQAATPYIGQRNRWLAPLGASDLDGDGFSEIAYVDRPHLARVLRIWRYRDGALREVAAAEGVTNHRIGWNYIAGGIRNCGQGPEMIVASADWRQVLALRFDRALRARALGGYTSERIAAAMACR